MSDRVIDTERAGAAAPVLDLPHDEFPPAPPVSAAQACAAVDGWLESEMPLFGLHQIAVALRKEIPLLEDVAKDALRETNLERVKLARIRRALADIIGCPHGEGTACKRDPYGWGMCCVVRLRMAKAGLP